MLKISKDLCIGCGACQSINPDIFDIENDGLACVVENADIENNKEDIDDAIDGCPTSAISYIENN